MECPSCGSANQDGHRFCGNCGAPLPPCCGVCGRENPIGNSYCGYCGYCGLLRLLRLLRRSFDQCRRSSGTIISRRYAYQAGATRCRTSVSHCHVLRPRRLDRDFVSA
jgi:Double zinc ribbon